MSQEQLLLENYGKSLIGKVAQSTIIRIISPCGQYSIPEQAQKITGYEIVEEFQKPTLMVTLGGESVFEDTLFNIRKN